MNKTAFIGATAIVVVATVAGYRYRHIALEQLDKWLHPRVQDPEAKETVTGYVDGVQRQFPKEFVDELERSMKHPETRVTRERPQRHEEETGG